MSLVTIGVLVGVVFGVLRLLLAANERKPPQAPPGPLGTWGGHSDYRQLRIEYHREVDRSLSPPRH
jgi:hypothetical protein